MIQTAFLLDIDKTLTNSNREITDLTRLILTKLNAKKIPVGVCTGRVYATLWEYALPLFAPTTLHVVAGGAQLIQADGQIRWEKNLTHEVVKDICLTVKKLGGEFGFGQGKNFYYSEGLLAKFQSNHWLGKATLPNDLTNWQTPLLNLRFLNPAIEAYIEQYPDLTAKKLKSYDGTAYYDLTAAGVSKATGAQQWAKSLGIDLKDVIAVGDDLNDLEMLAAVGHGVAMGNAAPELKAVAAEVIGQADEDGLAQYLEKFI